MQKLFFLYLHKYNIRPDLADTAKGNDIFTVCSKKAADLSRAGYNKGLHLSCTYIDLYIHCAAQLSAAADINNLFVPELTDPHMPSSTQDTVSH